MSNPSWGIVMTVREPAQLVLANVHYHLGQGAEKIHVFLDDPNDPVGDLLAEIPGCHVYRCDAEHWGRIAKSGRPEKQTRRQVLNATHMYRRCKLDWLVHLDADEFLYQKRPLSEELSFAPHDVGSLIFEVRERVYLGSQSDLFDGAYRVPIEAGDTLMASLFGEFTPFLRSGVSGHAGGKPCVPTGRRHMQLGIHAPRFFKGEPLPRLRSASTVLLHFDGLTRLHWMVKLMRYAAEGPKGMVGPHRMAQLEFFKKGCESLDEIGQFHDALKQVDTEEAARLTALGLLEALPFDVGDAARSAVKAPGLSLDAEAFDAELRIRNADLLEA